MTAVATLTLQQHVVQLHVAMDDLRSHHQSHGQARAEVALAFDNLKRTAQPPKWHGLAATSYLGNALVQVLQAPGNVDGPPQRVLHGVQPLALHHALLHHGLQRASVHILGHLARRGGGTARRGGSLSLWSLCKQVSGPGVLECLPDAGLA